MSVDLDAKIEIDTKQKELINNLNSKMKRVKTNKQHLERSIQQLKEFKKSVDEITGEKISRLTEE